MFYKQILTHKKRKCIPYIYRCNNWHWSYLYTLQGFKIFIINDPVEERDEPITYK